MQENLPIGKPTCASAIENPFTDAYIDELINTPAPEPTIDYEVYSKYTLGQIINSGTHYIDHNCACYIDYCNMFAKMSLNNYKKVILHNTWFAYYTLEYLTKTDKAKCSLTPIERNTLINWILDMDFITSNLALSMIQRQYHLVEQFNRLCDDIETSEYTLHSCFRVMCCDMPQRSHIDDNDYLSLVESRFDRLQAHPRYDPSIENNCALSYAVLHKNTYAIHKLLGDTRVQACQNWDRVVEGAFRAGDQETCKLIMSQPNAKFTREVIEFVRYKNKNKTKFNWIYSHPKWNPDIFKLKTAEELATMALQVCNEGGQLDKVKLIMEVLLRRLRSEPENPDEHYDHESIAYIS